MVPTVTHRSPANQARVKVASNTVALIAPVSRILAAVVIAVTDTAVELAKAFVNRVIMPAHAVAKHSGLDTDQCSLHSIADFERAFEDTGNAPALQANTGA